MGVEVILVGKNWARKLQDVCGIVSKNLPSLFGVLGVFVLGWWCVCCVVAL